MGVLDDYKYSSGNTGGNGTVNFGVQLGHAISTTATSVGKAIGNLFDPSQTRLASTDLLNVSSNKSNKSPTVTWVTQNGGTQSSGVLADDWRLRLSVSPSAQILYNNQTSKFLQPILNTSGVIFPVTPNLQVTHNAKYSPQSLTHSNYGMHFYEGSEVASITISGEFPIQNIEEGQYLLAAIYFFRAATKMYWGNDGQDLAGTPPPMLFLDGYGAHYFPHVSCVVTSFQHSLPDNVDYIDIPTLDGTGEKTRLPTLSTLTVIVQPLMSRTAAHKFNLEDFAHGKMITGGYM